MERVRKLRKRNIEKGKDDWWPSNPYTIYTTYTLLTKPDAKTLSQRNQRPDHAPGSVQRREREPVTRGKVVSHDFKWMDTNGCTQLC